MRKYPDKQPDPVAQPISGPHYQQREVYNQYGSVPADVSAALLTDDQTQNDLGKQKNAAFSYPFELSKLRRDVRLLELLPSDVDNGEKIQCRIVSSTLTDVGASRKYIALSYTWEIANGAEDIKPIIIDSQLFWIHNNLWDFLDTMRQISVTGPFFIDAICINQLNKSEILSLLPMMGEVYSWAESVSVWLGRLPIEIAATPLEHRRTSTLSWHRYFSRVWIVQELLRARAITLFCGVWSVPWEFFEHDFYNAKDTSEIRAWGSYAQNLIRSKRDWSTGYYPDGMPMYKIIEYFGRQECTVPRDKLFGFFGLLPRAYAPAADTLDLPTMGWTSIMLAIEEIFRGIRVVHEREEKKRIVIDHYEAVLGVQLRQKLGFRGLNVATPFIFPNNQVRSGVSSFLRTGGKFMPRSYS